MERRSFIAAIISTLIAAGMLLTGCNWLLTTKDTGPLTTREFDFTNFNVVEVGSAFKVDISASDTYSVKITTNENLFKDISVTKTGNTLKIGLEWPSMFFGARTLEARITMPELTGLEISGATKGTVRGFKSGNDLNARISGASTLDLDVETGNFISKISGSSKVTARIKSTSTDIEMSGASKLTLDMDTGNFVYESSGASDASGGLKAASTTIHLTGASEMQFTGSGGDLKLIGSGASEAMLRGFNIEDANIHLSGATHADVDINGRLSVSLSGGSELRYGGNPILGDKMDITGGSRLEHR